jgi:lysophospholipase L1-like esterase
MGYLIKIAAQQLNIIIIGDSTIAERNPPLSYSVKSLLNNDDLFSITDLSQSGSTIDYQKTDYNNLSVRIKQDADYVFVQIGINDIHTNGEPYIDIFNRYQLLITAIKNASGHRTKIIGSCIIKCKSFLDTLDDAQAWTKLQSLNADIFAKNFTGLDYSTNTASEALSDAQGNLLSEYEWTNDHIHENSAGKQIIADSWKTVMPPLLAANSYESETVAYLARMTVQPNRVTKNLINNLIKGWKTDGVWDEIDSCSLMNLHTRQASYLNIKGISVFPDFTFYGTEANTTWVAKNGFTIINTGACINSKFIPANGVKFTQNDCLIFRVLSGTGTMVDGCSDANSGSWFSDRSDHLHNRLNSNSSVTATNTKGVKANMLIRQNDANNIIIRSNGSENTFVEASAARSTTEYYIGDMNLNGTLFGRNENTYKQYGFGSGMDATKRAAIESRLETFNTALLTAF